VADINGGAVDAAVARLGAAGVTAAGVACDVSRSADVAAMVERARTELGGVDVCVANAGGRAWWGKGEEMAGAGREAARLLHPLCARPRACLSPRGERPPGLVDATAAPRPPARARARPPARHRARRAVPGDERGRL
jgi:hypothetical protein